MTQMTITEALAELKMLQKRIAKKESGLEPYLLRQDKVKDPLSAEGGSAAWVAAQRQGLSDLHERIVKIRGSINRANSDTMLALGGKERSIADWIVWRRDVAPLVARLHSALNGAVRQARDFAKSKNVRLLTDGSEAGPDDIVVSFRETDLQAEIEAHEELMGTLDGKLSLLNATTLVTIPD